VDDDPGAAVSEASVVIRGNTFLLEPDPAEDNSYFVDVDFTDSALFSESPTGELNVLVQASNSRAVQSRVRFNTPSRWTARLRTSSSPIRATVRSSAVGQPAVHGRR